MELKICPEDELGILLPARATPNNAAVSKRTGNKRLTLVTQLKVYMLPPEPLDAEGNKAKPPVVELAGLFLMDGTSVNQVDPEAMLHWWVMADEFADRLQLAWEDKDDK